jgi:L1 cell adhesion molecule like protein
MPRGVPQIEVSFDIDANGILNVTAVEKSTGKSNNVTIKNDGSRLSKEDIERMTNDAETYAKEDAEFKEKVESKNGLENYCFSIKNTISDEKLKDNIPEDDKKMIEEKIDDTLKWLEANNSTPKEEYETKRKELEETFKPIMDKLMPSGMPTEMPSTTENTNSGPNIEEVD